MANPSRIEKSSRTAKASGRIFETDLDQTSEILYTFTHGQSGGKQTEYERIVSPTIPMPAENRLVLSAQTPESTRSYSQNRLGSKTHGDGISTG
jgi:hypothetical protein